tara:strand:- start:1055 stop:1852 length:798 start_codon:yes stop_codon:yes gene_type:complete
MLFDPSNQFLIIAGPCAIESEAICHTVAEALATLKAEIGSLSIIFKSSFDKANRTSLGSGRGVGMKEGLKILAKIKETYQLPIVTDVHESHQCAEVAEVCDVLQIPAFLCRQTDLLVAAGKSGRAVNVKKGQFLAPQDMQYVVQKLEECGTQEIWQTERGTTFGYHNLVVDMRSFPIMRSFGHPVILDATHCVQLPGGLQGKSGGQREFIPPLAQAACAAGADGLYIETHPDPDRAISDAASQIHLKNFPTLVRNCLAIHQAAKL